MARSGARVLHGRAVEYARDKGIALYARKTGVEDGGTVIRRDAPAPESSVAAISHREQVLRADLPRDGAPATLGRLTSAGARIDQVLLMKDELRCLLDVTDLVAPPSGLTGVDASSFGCVTIVGRAHAGSFDVTAKALETLEASGVTVDSTWMEPSAAHLVVPRADVAGAARRLHAAFGLGTA
jgi:aspartate kinase